MIQMFNHYLSLGRSQHDYSQQQLTTIASLVKNTTNSVAYYRTPSLNSQIYKLYCLSYSILQPSTFSLHVCYVI